MTNEHENRLGTKDVHQLLLRLLSTLKEWGEHPYHIEFSDWNGRLDLRIQIEPQPPRPMQLDKWNRVI